MGVITIKNKELLKKKMALYLLETEEAVTVSELANRIEVSNRTARSYLNELEGELKQLGMNLVKKPHVGVYIDVDNDMRIEFKSKWLERDSQTEKYTSAYRRKYILKTLFENKWSYTAKLFAEELYCSQASIAKDLSYIESWLGNRELILHKRQNQGLWIEGEEKAYRRAMIDLFHEMKNENVSDLEEIESLDYRISDENFQRMKSFFPKVDFWKIQEAIQETEDGLGYYFTDQAFINLMIHIAIALERVKHEKPIEFAEEKLEQMETKEEYEKASELLDWLSKAFEINFPKEEIGYLTLHILGSKVQQFSDALESELIVEVGEELCVDMAKEIMTLAEQILGFNLSNDQILLTSLVLHLRPTIFRLKNGLKLRNPILDRIKSEYTSIFGAAWSCSPVFERMLGVQINEDEVGYIAMHIAGAMGRANQKTRVMVVCSSGIGTAQFITVKLNDKFDGIDIVKTLSVSQVTQSAIDEVDLIISTVRTPFKSEKIVQVSALLSERDLLKIQKAMLKFGKGNIKEVSHKTKEQEIIEEVIEDELCFIESASMNFVELIEKYGAKLEQKGFVKPGFTQNVIARETKGSTYIGNGVAIPHSTQDFVNDSKICIVKLNKPITWQKNKIKLVVLLALKFEEIDSTKAFFKRLYALLEHNDFLTRIEESKACFEIIEIFKTGGV